MEDVIYYLMKVDNILEVFTDKDKAYKKLKELREQNNNDYFNYYVFENTTFKSNNLFCKNNEIYTILLNGIPFYSIVNNKFTAVKTSKRLLEENSNNKWARKFELRVDLV